MAREVTTRRVAARLAGVVGVLWGAATLTFVIEQLMPTDPAQTILGAFLQAIIDHIANPIFYKGPDLRFRGCNRAYEKTFGVDRANFLGKTVLDLAYLPLDDRNKYQAEDAAVVAVRAPTGA